MRYGRIEPLLLNGRKTRVEFAGQRSLHSDGEPAFSAATLRWGVASPHDIIDHPITVIVDLVTFLG